MLGVNDYLSSIGTLQALGETGFMAYMFAFASVQMNWMDGNGIAYTLWNMLDASLDGISLIAEFNLSSALIQASWVLIGLVGLTRRIARKRTAHKSSRSA